MAEHPCRPYASDSYLVDEDEVESNFDQEASLIVQSSTLPKKSIEQYLCVYNKYKTWRNENKNSLSDSEANQLIVYFNELKVKLSLQLYGAYGARLKIL